MTLYTSMFSCYAMSALLGLAMLLLHPKLSVPVRQGVAAASQFLILVGLTLGVVILGAAWLSTGHPPFQTLFQSIVFFSVTTALVFLVVGRQVPVIGLATAGFISLILLYGFVRRDLEAVEIPPALQSAWFVPHVVVYFLGYAALFLSFVTAILELVFPGGRHLAHGNRWGFDNLHFHRWTYLAILFGFVMLSLGLIFGAYWAKYAWGDWWSWDPKENWALISWLVYAAYLHLRRVPGMSPNALAWTAILGFLAVMFTYLGVNYLPAAQQALHSYAR